MDLSSLSPMVGYFRCSSLPLSPLSLSVSYPYSHTLTLILFLSRTPAFSPSLPLSLSLTSLAPLILLWLSFPCATTGRCLSWSPAWWRACSGGDLAHLGTWSYGSDGSVGLTTWRNGGTASSAFPVTAGSRQQTNGRALCSAGAAL